MACLDEINLHLKRFLANSAENIYSFFGRKNLLLCWPDTQWTIPIRNQTEILIFCFLFCRSFHYKPLAYKSLISSYLQELKFNPIQNVCVGFFNELSKSWSSSVCLPDNNWADLAMNIKFVQFYHKSVTDLSTGQVFRSSKEKEYM